MKPIGTILKNARMKEGLSIDELYAKTHIRAQYIRAIEENDWNSLPGSTYAHGFIKRYADAVNLDPEKVHAVFRREYKIKEQQKIIPDGMLDRPIEKPNVFLTLRGWIAKLVT